MFHRANIMEAALDAVVAHEGSGDIGFARILSRDDVDGPVNFVDVAVVPPGVSIGMHQHDALEEEYYLVLQGEGVMVRDDGPIRLRAGDLVRNPPGGTHGFTNDGDVDVRLFVFEVRVGR